MTRVDPGFQVRGEGAALKKIAPSGGRRENCWGISCEKSRFYAKKSYFFQLRRVTRKLLGYFVWKITILRQKIIFFPIAEGGANIFGVFRVKNHDFTPKYLFFSNFRGGAGCAPPPPPVSAPGSNIIIVSGVHVTRSLVLYVCFVDRCFFWSLCCLFFFDIRILITPLVSSNSSGTR